MTRDMERFNLLHDMEGAAMWEPYFKHVSEHAPKWGSKDPNYNFKASEDFIAQSFSGLWTKDDFSRQFNSFIKRELKKYSSYPEQAHLGWFVSVLINVLEREGEQALIIEENLPALWTEFAKEKGVNKYRMADEFNPAILNNLKGETRTAFLKQLQDFTDGIICEQPLQEVVYIINEHIEIASHSGVYGFEEDRTDIARAFMAGGNAKKIIENFNESFGDWRQFYMFSNLLARGTEVQKQDLAQRLYDQITPQKIIEESSNTLDGGWSRAVFRFNALFMQVLPENMRFSYAENFLYTLKEKTVRVFANSGSSYGFIDALPENLARKTVKMVTQAALNLDYSAEDGDYGSTEGYWYRMRFANDVYALIPEKYNLDFEQTILEYLEQASPKYKERALIKASILLRESLSEKGNLRTKEVDFYASPRPGNPHRSAIAHIKPTITGGRKGMVAVQSFLGQIKDFDTQTSPDFQTSGRRPRDCPPHECEIFTQEEYRGFLAPIFAAEHDALLDKNESLPSLVDVLRARLPHYSLANPRYLLLPA